MSAFAPLPEPRCGFVLLAAGKGARFGGGKLTANLGGKPLWRWAAESAVMGGMNALHLVTNDPQIASEAAAIGWTVHPNQAADEGVASSIRLAARAAASCQRLVVALADMPFVEPEHLRRLAAAKGAAFTKQSDGCAGVPAAFPATAYAQLARLTGNRGAAALHWPDSESITPASPEALFDIDTAADLDRAREIAVRRAREACR